MSKYIDISSALSFFFLFINLVFSQLPSNQIATMTKLYEMLQNDSRNSPFPWSNVEKDSNPCSWMGVSCSSSNSSVTKLSLSMFSISSPEILPVVCQIDSLESLDLSNNHLSSIPGAFISACGVISGLKLLNFSRNNLTVSFPSFIGFQKLEALDLSRNSLMGSITVQLDGLDSLKSLNLSNNEFTGPLPTNLGKNNLLQELQLSFNHFQGEIPVEILKYGNLTLIDLSFNQLFGSIPQRFGELSKLQTLVLSANDLSGGIPKSLVNIQTLLQFAANLNNFVGNIPAGITTYLRNLDLSFNSLSGTIPPDLLSQTNLQSVDLSSNLLEGLIPTDISVSLFRLRLGANSLNGTISFRSYESLTKLTYLELDSNNLTGEIPPELGLCQSLALLNLAQNGLTGVLPAQLGNLTKLQVLYLQKNKLVGVIPEQFTQLHSLQRMNFSSNSINGSIPASTSKLQHLTNLDLRHNNLSGPIPASIGTLDFLLELQLGNNQLSGDIPAMPSSLQIALNLSNNFFGGTIPVTLSQLNELEVLDLSNNNFSGAIPSFLTEMAGLTQLVLSNNQLSGDIPKFKQYVTVVTDGNNLNKAYSTKHSKGLSTGTVIAVAFFSGLIFSFMIVKIIPLVNYPWDRTKFEWIINDGIHKSGFGFSKAMKEVQRQASILSKSEFGTYCKASMPCGLNYSIKKLYWTSKTFSLVSPEKFSHEVKLLNQLSKSNIMIPLAYALTVKAAILIYECPQHGTLYDLLHGSDENVLTWEIRYNIAVSVSKGLAHLHGFYDSTSAPVVLLHLSTRSIFM